MYIHVYYDEPLGTKEVLTTKKTTRKTVYAAITKKTSCLRAMMNVTMHMPKN